MEKITILNSHSTYKNRGQVAQQDADYTLTGQVRPHDHIAFDKGSDIPELDISVKSARFTLATTLKGDTLAEMLNDYLNRVASTTALYITKDRIGYRMTMTEFKAFIEEFGTVEYASAKNGGGKVVRCKSESKAMLKWLESQVA